MKCVSKILKISWLIVVFIGLIGGILEPSLEGDKKAIFVIGTIIIILSQLYFWISESKEMKRELLFYKNSRWLCKEHFFEINVIEGNKLKSKIKIKDDIRDVYLNCIGEYIECFSNLDREKIYFYGNIFVKNNDCILNIEEKYCDIFNNHDTIVLKKVS